ncbi:hypothetical protein B0T25DRAFT_559904 [Lasiosphaeria hispida]|uniref:Secreted protein n=1 Tax=Lasiosphaeria hispida TaxID=260671 RepID=A0AAJ0H7I5_9PEZI|nr:hypothetical protein B0T25DRAFT_559904 [Lasiosphaeria hispida]
MTLKRAQLSLKILLLLLRLPLMSIFASQIHPSLPTRARIDSSIVHIAHGLAKVQPTHGSIFFANTILSWIRLFIPLRSH